MKSKEQKEIIGRELIDEQLDSIHGGDGEFELTRGVARYCALSSPTLGVARHRALSSPPLGVARHRALSSPPPGVAQLAD